MLDRKPVCPARAPQSRTRGVVRVCRPFPDVHHESVQGEVTAAVSLALIMRRSTTSDIQPYTIPGTVEFTPNLSHLLISLIQDPPVLLASAIRWGF